MKHKTYPAYKDSGIDWLGPAPTHWAVKRLRFAAQLNPSKSEIGKLSPDTAVSFLPMEAIGDDGTLNIERVRAIGEVESGYSYFREGDVSIAKITPCFENGKGAVMRGLEKGVGFGTTELIVARPRASSTTSDYLHWLFISSPFRKIGESHMYGAGGQKRVPDDFVRDFAVALPPLEEQIAIAAFLDRETSKIDTLIAKQERLIELLQEKKQATISHAVSKGLNPNASMKESGVEWLGEVPAHWVSASLRRVATRIVVGIAEAATHAYSDTGVPILRSTNIRSNRIEGEILHLQPEFAKERGSKLIHAGDLITVRTGAPGITAVVPNELDGCQCFTMLITSLKATCLPQFFSYAINSDQGQRYFFLEGWGTAQLNISVPILKSLPVAVPPLQEQQKIVEFLDHESIRINDLIGKCRRSIDLMRERRSALISAAVSGKMDVRDEADKEAA